MSGNCTNSVRTIIKMDDKYEKRSKNFDCTWLLKKVKTVISGIDTKINLKVSLHTAMTIFLLLKQYGNKTIDALFNSFQICDTDVDHCMSQAHTGQ